VALLGWKVKRSIRIFALTVLTFADTQRTEVLRGVAKAFVRHMAGPSLRLAARL